ncbi:MAG: hypothetical protein MI976_28480 [Pseudomonadales bacterium]|nr:hypothetical protein [Pseudomonadales bacterium]
MEIVLLTCALGLFNIFGVASASDDHLDQQGLTAQQLNAAIPHPEKRGSLLEAFRSSDNSSAQQQQESAKVSVELAVNE